VLQVTVNSLYFEVLSINITRKLAAECMVFGDNSATEFNKLCHGIWQNLMRKNGPWSLVFYDLSQMTVLT